MFNWAFIKLTVDVHLGLYQTDCSLGPISNQIYLNLLTYIILRVSNIHIVLELRTWLGSTSIPHDIWSTSSVCQQQKKNQAAWIMQPISHLSICVPIKYKKLQIQSRPLVRSAFCPKKIDHTSGQTLHPYTLFTVIRGCQWLISQGKSIPDINYSLLCSKIMTESLITMTYVD